MDWEQGRGELIDRIYQAASAPGGFVPVLGTLEQRLRGRVALFWLQPDSVETIVKCSEASRPRVEAYEAHLWPEDRAMQALRGEANERIITDVDLISDRERQLSAFYGRYLGDHGLHRGLYLSIKREAGAPFVLSAQRSAATGDYRDDEIAWLRELSIHFHRSLANWHKVASLEAERNAALIAAADARHPVLLVDARGTIRFANDAAQRMLSDGTLREQGRRLRLGGVADRLFMQALARATDPSEVARAQCIPVEAADGLLSLAVNGAPSTSPQTPTSLRLAVVSVVPRGPREPLEWAVARFGFTASEARLAAALLEGKRLSEYAARSGIKLATAKTHLNALFDKTGERRQANLIRLLLAAAPEA